MVVRPSLFATDEELAKRDDDHKPNGVAPWLPTNRLPLFRRRRIIGVLIALALVYVFIHNIPVLGPAGERRNPYARARPQDDRPERPTSIPDSPPTAPQKGTPPPTDLDDKSPNAKAHNFDGPVRFYYLATSLHGIAKTSGYSPSNKNVLFAASDLKSASALIPLACEMATWKRNHVHVALMGRNEVPLDEIQRINGATKDACEVYWHDARPDYALYSTDHRMEVSVAGALNHIENFMHPQAVITTDFDDEDAFFAKAVANKGKELGHTHIELPRDVADSFTWLTRLEAQSLSMWHDASIDILVQAPKESVGSLIRLLRSLSNAYYDGFVVPRLTIELPARPSDETKDFIDSFEWPPSRYRHSSAAHQFVLRRRIPGKRLGVEDASTRFIESFYPADPQNSHVLILSPQAELSPVYFYYLKYQLLEYKYSSTGIKESTELFGISLETPSVHLNGTANFEIPPQRNAHSDDDPVHIEPFLWQAPNSHATLYFGQMWAELHSFLTHQHTAMLHPETRTYHLDRRKSVSAKEPSWAEYALDLMKARGYMILYPGRMVQQDRPDSDEASPSGESLVAIHNDLYRPPEEFSKSSRGGGSSPKALNPSDVLDAPVDYLAAHHRSPQRDNLNIETPLMTNLNPFICPNPFLPSAHTEKGHSTAPRPPFTHLSLLNVLDHYGELATQSRLQEDAYNFAIQYRQEAGACSRADAEQDILVVDGVADDLFCFSEEDEEDTIDLFEDRPVRRTTTTHVTHHKTTLESTRTSSTSRATVTSSSKTTLPPVQPARPTQPTSEASTAPTTSATSTINKAPPHIGHAAHMAEEARQADPLKAAGPDGRGLNDVERAELDSWRAKQRKDGTLHNSEVDTEPAAGQAGTVDPAPRAKSEAAKAEEERQRQLVDEEPESEKLKESRPVRAPAEREDLELPVLKKDRERESLEVERAKKAKDGNGPSYKQPAPGLRGVGQSDHDEEKARQAVVPDSRGYVQGRGNPGRQVPEAATSKDPRRKEDATETTANARVVGAVDKDATTRPVAAETIGVMTKGADQTARVGVDPVEDNKAPAKTTKS